MSIILKKNSLFVKDGGEYKDIAVYSAPQTVEKWLDNHPEVTTSIQDGEVTFSKLNSTVQNRISGTESDVSTLQSGLSSEASARNAADTNLNNQISALRGAVGSPLVAATAAAMTDTDKIYVYTGNQSGYTNGNWYYYSGTAWVSGGVYNETALETDKTLTVEDKAADAKSVGDALVKLPYDSDKYYPQKNLLESPILDRFTSSAPGASIVESDDCNIVVLANTGSTARCNLRLKSTVNNKIYILVCAKKISEGTTYLNILEGVIGSDSILLGKLTLTSEFVYYNLEYDLTQTDVNYIRFSNSSPNTTLQFTCVVVSDEPITYEYSTKALLKKVDARSAESATILNGGVSVDNLSDDLRNAFYYRYADFGAVWENGFYINTSGARVELSTGNVATVSVLTGERYKIVSSNGSALKAYVFIDGDGNISYYPTEKVSTRFETVIFVAPSDGTLYAQSYNSANYSIVKAIGATIATDKTLSEADKAADAKIVGDAIVELKNDVDYSSDKYYSYKNMLAYPNLTAFQGSAPGAEIILNDDCNIVRITNSGQSARCNFALRQPINNKVYISFKARYVNALNNIRLSILEGDGTSVVNLGYVVISNIWTVYTVEYNLSLSDVSLIRFGNGNANTSLEITNIIVSNEQINHDYSTKTKIDNIQSVSNQNQTVLNGNISIDNLGTDLKNVFNYTYSDFGATFIDGYYMNISGILTTLSSGHYAEISAIAGERFRISSSHGSALRMYVFKDIDGNVTNYYPIDSVPTVTETIDFVAPSNGTLYVNSYGGAVYQVLKSYGLVVAADGGGISGKTWFALGDSITHYANGYHKIISDKTGVIVTNGGVSGNGYMKPINNKTFVDRSQLSFVYDIVTVFGSVNDMQYVADHLGTATDTGTETLGGCFNSVITNLYASGNYHIGIISPIPQGSTAGNPANTSGSFAQYTALLQEVCKLRGVPYLDLWHCSNIQPWDITFEETYMLDNTHPNADGHAIFAPRIKAFIESL